MRINVKKLLLAVCFLFLGLYVITMLRSNKKHAELTKQNRTLLIQKDSLLAEKQDYEKKFLQLLQQFDTIEKKKAVDNTVIFIPKEKRKGKLVSVKKSEVFN